MALPEAQAATWAEPTKHGQWSLLPSLVVQNLTWNFIEPFSFSILLLLKSLYESVLKKSQALKCSVWPKKATDVVSNCDCNSNKSSFELCFPLLPVSIYLIYHQKINQLILPVFSVFNYSWYYFSICLRYWEVRSTRGWGRPCAFTQIALHVWRCLRLLWSPFSFHVSSEKQWVTWFGPSRVHHRH